MNALRAFEAAARLGGFALAAEELCVTPGAVSQHIKALEDWTGAPLFERRSQGVRLTQAGADLAPMFTLAFDQLGAATRELRAAAPQATIQIAALPSVAQLWLSPRLPALRAALPQVKLSISALETPPNLQREMFDLSLFIREPTGSITETVLQEDWIFPVCSPGVAARLHSFQALNGETLIHDHIWAQDWTLWADGAGAALKDAQAGSFFSLYSLALEEAKNGAGVLIGHSCLVGPALSRAELVQPFAYAAPTGKALVLELAQSRAVSNELMQVVSILTGI